MMKRLISFLTFFFLLSAYAHAEEGQRIAVIDLGKILSQSAAMKNLNTQIKAEDDKLKKLAKDRENSFRKEQQDLAQQRTIISPEQFNQKSKALNDKGVGYRKEFQQKLKQLAESKSAAVKKIEAAMEPIVLQTAKKLGATMIVERKKTIFGAQSLDISEMIIKELNKKVKTMKFVLVPIKS